MSNVDNHLLYEILKKMQADIADIKSTLADHTRQFLRIREDINGVREDINDLRHNDVRHETMQVKMDTRLERIETRLNLNDA